MELLGLEVKNCEPLKVVKNWGDTLIATSDEFTGNYPTANEQGILVCPEFKESSIQNGDMVFYKQVVLSHYQEVVLESGDKLVYSSGEIMKDTKSLALKYYDSFVYNNGFTYPYDPCFFDVIFSQLFDHWFSHRYRIHFRTQIGYVRDINENMLASFDWKHEILLNKGKSGEWAVESIECSDKFDVDNSIIYTDLDV
ncbi:MAG: hypothetical protein AAF731_12265 [Bacteroidota bacterium]